MGDDPFRALLTALTSKGLETVDCSGMYMDDEQFSILITAMEHSPKRVQALNASRNCITSSGAALLVHFMKSFPLNELHMTHNKIEEDGAQLFIALFSKTDEFPTSFDISENPCVETTAARLAFLAKRQMYNSSINDALLNKKATAVTFSGISCSRMDSRLMRFLCTEVEGLESIDFAGCDLGDSGLFMIGGFVKDSKVQSISFAQCQITGAGVMRFAEAANLPHHPTLTKIDLSQNMGITNEVVRKLQTVVFEKNTVLTEVRLADTSVTSDSRDTIQRECDLNKEPPLLKEVAVKLRNNAPELTTVNFQWEKNMKRSVFYLWRAIRDSSALTHLNLSNTGLDDDDLSLLADALQRNTSLKILELANNSFTLVGLEKICAILKRGRCNLEELNLANNDLDNTCVGMICDTIRSNVKLTEMNLNVNPSISAAALYEIQGLLCVNRAPSAVRALLPLLENNSSDLTVLDFSGNGVVINDELVRIMVKALAGNTHVTKMDFTGNVISDTGMEHLAFLLAENKSITDLRIAKNNFSGRGATRLFDTLPVNASLRYLDLSDNVIGDDCILGLLPLLRVNHALLSVLVANTRVSPATVELLNHACAMNMQAPSVKNAYYRLLDNDESFTEIHLCDIGAERPLNNETLKILETVLTEKHQVFAVNLAGNQIGQEGCASIARIMCAERCGVVCLDLSRNPLDDNAIAELAAFLPANKSVVDINLSETGMTENGAQVLAAALKVNDTVQSVAFPEAICGTAGATKLVRALEVNREHNAVKKVILQVESGEGSVEAVELVAICSPDFGDKGCELLCESLMQNSSVRSIDLSHNKITSASIPYIAEVLHCCPNIYHIDLSHNNIDERGAALLLSSLEQLEHVRSAPFVGNPVSQASTDRITAVANMNLGSQKLKSLQLLQSKGENFPEMLDLNGDSNNHKLTDDEMTVLAALLKNCADVKFMDLSNNSFTDRGCAAIADVLRTNHSMEVLLMNNNSITGLGGEALYHALKINPQLSVLELSGTGVSAALLEDIVSLLHVNETPLRKLVDMRTTKVEQIDDKTQFRSTDYFLAQNTNLGEEAVRGKKSADQLLLN